jgi:hypothetical protein
MAERGDRANRIATTIGTRGRIARRMAKLPRQRQTNFFGRRIGGPGIRRFAHRGGHRAMAPATGDEDQGRVAEKLSNATVPGGFG